MSEEKTPAKRGRPPIERPKPPSRKDMADNARFWLSLQTLKSNPITKKKELLSQLDLMTIKMINKAKDGNVNAYNALMDRAFGKPKQYTEVDINQRVTIAAFEWADDKLPAGATPIQQPQGEEIEYEPIEQPDEDVQEFERETESE